MADTLVVIASAALPRARVATTDTLVVIASAALPRAAGRHN
jgi:hypothetical protein